MIKRFVEVRNPAYLHLRRDQMVVTRDRLDVGQVPIEDLGVLLLEHPQITLSLALLSACADGNVLVVACDEKHHPASVLMPLEGNHVHAQVIRAQTNVPAPRCKQLWKSLVQAKIRHQAAALDQMGIPSEVVRGLAKSVRSGDPDNLEARAAQRYWPLLMGAGFRRSDDDHVLNDALNYGYALIRAGLARAIVGTGLHPALGIHHSHRNNAFALVDDLLEPFRPLVDVEVCRHWGQNPPESLSSAMREQLILLLERSILWEGRTTPLLIAMQLFAAHFRRTLCGEVRTLTVPILWP